VLRGWPEKPCGIAIGIAQPDRPVGPPMMTGMRSWIGASSSFAPVVMVAKV
jgi:hypothetical protein